MVFYRLKYATSFLVGMLALLQVFLPLIHAHPADSALGAMTSGLHMHAEDFSAKSFDEVSLASADHHLLEVVGVPNGNEPEKILIPIAVLFCLFVIALLQLVLTSGILSRSEVVFSVRRSPYLLSHPLRAPPPQ